MKARRVVLIIVLIIVVIAAILLIKNRETISMLKYMKADQAEIQAKQEQLLEEDAQIKDSLGLSDMEISEEDIAAIESGEKTAEEVAQSIVANTSQQGTSQETSSGDGAASEGTQTSDGTQAQPGTDASSENGGTAQSGETSQSGDTASDAQTSQQDESQARIQTLVAQAYVLQSSFTGRANGLIESMKHEFWSLPKDQQNTANKMKVVRSYMSQISVLENECDSEMASIISSVRELDPELASELEQHYEDVKANTKASLISQYS
ncbi:MAG: hypothetical protein IIY34_01310 [Clostridia bacterium]|nr:hypothetical protein [Clostridia bacterium]